MLEGNRGACFRDGCALNIVTVTVTVTRLSTFKIHEGAGQLATLFITVVMQRNHPAYTCCMYHKELCFILTSDLFIHGPAISRGVATKRLLTRNLSRRANMSHRMLVILHKAILYRSYQMLLVPLNSLLKW